MSQSLSQILIVFNISGFWRNGSWKFTLFPSSFFQFTFFPSKIAYPIVNVFRIVEDNLENVANLTFMMDVPREI